MDHHLERHDRIRQMRERGDSIDDIVSALDISWQMEAVVPRIVRKFETEAVLSARSSRFMEQIRNADDLDKEWKTGVLMQALRPKVMTQNAVIRFCKGKTIGMMSLRELMDLTVPAVDPVRPGFQVAPLLAVRCVGLEGFWSMVSRLTESDLGERSNSEWRRRLLRLSQCSRIYGGRGWWSKPCVLPESLLPFIGKG
jgi:DNA-binding transcriptional MerR regulator